MTFEKNKNQGEDVGVGTDIDIIDTNIIHHLLHIHFDSSDGVHCFPIG